MAGDITWLSGKKGYVKIREFTELGDEQWSWVPFGSWTFPMSATFVKRNVFRLDAAQGYQDGVSGFKASKPTAKGPWTEDAAPVTVGEFYDLLLGITDDGPLEYGVTAHLSDLTPSNDADGEGPMLDMTFDSVGAFDVASIGTEGGLSA